MNASSLFLRFFWPLYPADAKADLARSRSTDANPGGGRALLAHLDDAATRFVANAPALFGDGAADLRLDGSDDSVHRLAAALTRARREAWSAGGVPGEADNLLFNAVIHGAAYVGACIVACHGGTWGVRRPLWESIVRLRSRAGEADLPIFHWWLKSLADDALDDRTPVATLADRYRAHVEIPTRRASELTPFVRGPRTLPRLRSPSYDRLHKYLRAHLPEVRDLGPDFPDGARFAAYRLRWMDGHVVGEGRRVLLAGAAPEGVHLFWLSEAGFEASAFVAGETLTEDPVRIHGDWVTVTVSEAGPPRVRELFWWGV